MYHPPGQQEQPRLPQIQSQQQLPGQHNYPALNSPLRFTIPAQPNYLYLPQHLQQLQHVPLAQLQQVQPSAQFQPVPPSFHHLLNYHHLLNPIFKDQFSCRLDFNFHVFRHCRISLLTDLVIPKLKM